MIRVERPVDGPTSLIQKGTRGRLRGTTEENAIIAAYAEYCAKPKAEQEKQGFEFTFAAYKADDVREALTRLFGLSDQEVRVEGEHPPGRIEPFTRSRQRGHR